MSELERKEAIANTRSERELLVNRYESIIDQTLQDFDKAQKLYDEGKIPISKIQELKRKLEEYEFRLEQAKINGDRLILNLQKQ